MYEKRKDKTKPAWKERLKRHVPILKWYFFYKKKDFIADMIAGITLGLTLIPQSVAYAALAGLSAEYGLYSSFMGSFIYVIFGTVKEISIGPTSLLSLLTLEFTRELSIDFVFLLTFMSGIVEFLLGILQFGFLVNFISVPVTTSFQSATSLIIISSQLKDILGLPKFKSGRFLNNIITVGKKIHEAEMGDIVLSIFCCVFLISLRQLKNLRSSKNGDNKILWFVSISRNAICVFISCALGYVFSLYQQFPFRLSGSIPPGIPSLQLPKFHVHYENNTLYFPEMVYQIGPGIAILPLIAILANVTIAKTFSAGSPLDATQEMLTLGLCNICGAFIGSMPTSGAFTRSAVSNSSGVRTPLAGLFTGVIIILVLKFLTPCFYYIPKAALASILICSVIFMIDWKTILLLWKVNKPDFFCSAITFFACLIISIQVGLLLGVAANISHLLYLWARPSLNIKIEALSEKKYYKITPDTGLFFPANDFFCNEIIRHCIQNIPIVIDCLHFKGIDYTTIQGIKELDRRCKEKGQKLLFINVSFDIYSFLRNLNVDIILKQNAAEDELNDILFFFGESELFSATLLENTNASDIKNSVNE